LYLIYHNVHWDGFAFDSHYLHFFHTFPFHSLFKLQLVCQSWPVVPFFP
jgi:hypothetical protein